jgi:hypothetical protein
MSLTDYRDLAAQFRKNRRKTLAGIVMAVVVFVLAAVFGGFLSETGRQLASGQETTQAATPIKAETKGDNSPNIIGNKGDVKIEIGGSPKENDPK